jgi:hypothetical protein
MYIWIWKTPGGLDGGKGPHGLNEGMEDQFTSNLETRWTDPVTARRVPSKWSRGTREATEQGEQGNKGNKGSKGSKGIIVYI